MTRGSGVQVDVKCVHTQRPPPGGAPGPSVVRFNLGFHDLPPPPQCVRTSWKPPNGMRILHTHSVASARGSIEGLTSCLSSCTDTTQHP